MLINDCNISFLALFLTRREVFLSKIRSFNLRVERNLFSAGQNLFRCKMKMEILKWQFEFDIARFASLHYLNARQIFLRPILANLIASI